MSTTHATAVSVDDATSSSNKLCDEWFDREKVNLELYQLVWVDEKNSTSPDKITLRRLRKIIDYLKVFSNVTDCQDYLNETVDTTTFLVISFEELNKELLPQIQDRKNIWSIYRHSKNRRSHDPMLSNTEEVC